MRKLIRKAQKGDGEAFIELMELHKENMYKVACSYLRSEADIADVMQQTILDSFEKIGTLEQPRYFKTWLIRILINNCNDMLRESKKVLPMDEIREMEWENPQTDLMEFLDTLDSLDEKYRTILILYYVEGFKIREIAQLLKINESTVNSRLQRGRSCYREVLEHSIG